MYADMRTGEPRGIHTDMPQAYPDACMQICTQYTQLYSRMNPEIQTHVQTASRYILSTHKHTLADAQVRESKHTQITNRIDAKVDAKSTYRGGT